MKTKEELESERAESEHEGASAGVAFPDPLRTASGSAYITCA
jgi:hypothetical protein